MKIIEYFRMNIEYLRSAIRWIDYIKTIVTVQAFKVQPNLH